MQSSSAGRRSATSSSRTTTPRGPRASSRSTPRCAQALGPTARRIEHFGSTAVPGLGAKGIVDVLVTVDDADDEPAYGPALERARLRHPPPPARPPDVPDAGSGRPRPRLQRGQRRRAHPPPVPRLAPPQPRGPASLRGHQARVGAPGVGGDERLLHRQGRGGGGDPGPRAALGRRESFAPHALDRAAA